MNAMSRLPLIQSSSMAEILQRVLFMYLWDLFLAGEPDEMVVALNSIGPCQLCQNIWHLVDVEIFLYTTS